MKIEKSNSQQPQTSYSNKLIRIRQVIALTDISKSYIYQLCDKGLFPKSIQLVEGGSSVAWVEQEVLDWIESRIQARNTSAVGRSLSRNTVNTTNLNNYK